LAFFEKRLARQYTFAGLFSPTSNDGLHVESRLPSVPVWFIIPRMTTKGAAFLAFIGTLLIAILLTWTFVSHLLNVLRGVEAPIVTFAWCIYAFGSITLAVFFFVFHRAQS
jgi:hypothetical protein